MAGQLPIKNFVINKTMCRELNALCPMTLNKFTIHLFSPLDTHRFLCNDDNSRVFPDLIKIKRKLALYQQHSM